MEFPVVKPQGEPAAAGHAIGAAGAAGKGESPTGFDALLDRALAGGESLQVEEPIAPVEVRPEDEIEVAEDITGAEVVDEAAAMSAPAQGEAAAPAEVVASESLQSPDGSLGVEKPAAIVQEGGGEPAASLPGLFAGQDIQSDGDAVPAPGPASLPVAQAQAEGEGLPAPAPEPVSAPITGEAGANIQPAAETPAVEAAPIIVEGAAPVAEFAGESQPVEVAPAADSVQITAEAEAPAPVLETVTPAAGNAESLADFTVTENVEAEAEVKEPQAPAPAQATVEAAKAEAPIATGEADAAVKSQARALVDGAVRDGQPAAAKPEASQAGRNAAAAEAEAPAPEAGTQAPVSDVDAAASRGAGQEQVLPVQDPAAARLASAGGGAVNAAPAAPELAGETIAEPERGAVIEQVVRSARLNVAEGSSRFELRLDPPSLGRMAVRLDLEAGALSVSFRVENDSVRDLLQGSLPQLRAALAAQGLTVERFEVAAMDRGEAEGGSLPADSGGPNVEGDHKESGERQAASGGSDAGAEDGTAGDGSRPEGGGVTALRTGNGAVDYWA